MKSRDLLKLHTLPKNPFDKLQRVARRADELGQAQVVVPQLAGIAQDFGLISAGTIIQGNGLPLGAGFTGVMQFADPLEWPVGSGSYWHYIGFNSDVMMVGISASDGRLYAMGGDAQLGAGFIDYTSGIIPFRQRLAIDNGNFVARLGLFDAQMDSDSTARQPAFVLAVSDEVSQTSALLNGDFETGDFTNWTETETGDGAVTIESTDSKYSKYYAKLTSTTGNASIISDKFAITTNGVLTGKYRTTGTTNKRIYIHWYDNTPTLLLTQSVLPKDTNGQWISFWIPVLQYPSSTQVAIEVSNSVAGGQTLSVDDLEYIEWDTGSRALILRANEPPGYLLNDQENDAHYGDVPDAFVTPLDIAPVTVYTRTIKAGSMGAKGSFHVFVEGTQFNDTGASKVMSVIVTFGTSSQTVAFSGQNQSAANRGVYHLMVAVENLNSVSAQRITITADKHAPSAAGSNAVNANDYAYWVLGADDTDAADRDFTIQVASAADTDTQEADGQIMFFGPYFNS